jgi:hypothetical protein
VKRGFNAQSLALFSVALVLALTIDGFAQNREKFVISAKAGGINAVTGQASVHARGESDWQQLMITDDLNAGDRVRTAGDGRVEILLNPGSYLRVGGDSEIELANNSLDKLEVVLLRGTAIVEATGQDGIELNINVSTPHAKLAIVRHGLYRFNVMLNDNTTELIVRKGRVLLGDSQTKVKGGNKVVFVGANVSVAKLTDADKDKFKNDATELWSKERAQSLAKANSRITARMMRTAFASWTGFGFGSLRGTGLWFFNPTNRCYTFVPLFSGGWGSPYGGFYTTAIYPYPVYWTQPSNTGWTIPTTSTGSPSTSTSPSFPGNRAANPSSAIPVTRSPAPSDENGRILRKSTPN